MKIAEIKAKVHIIFRVHFAVLKTAKCVILRLEVIENEKREGNSDNETSREFVKSS